MSHTRRRETDLLVTKKVMRPDCLSIFSMGKICGSWWMYLQGKRWVEKEESEPNNSLAKSNKFSFRQLKAILTNRQKGEDFGIITCQGYEQLPASKCHHDDISPQPPSHAYIFGHSCKTVHWDHKTLECSKPCICIEIMESFFYSYAIEWCPLNPKP
jgi:hypothetical protein